MASYVEDVLNKFRKRVTKEAKTALTKQKKNASKVTYNSISSDLKTSKNSFQLGFFMEESAKFLDQGVTGKNDPNFKGKKKTVHRSLSGFRYGSGNFKGKGKEWEKRIDKWMYSRGIAPRDEKTGRFIKRKTANFLIRRSIYQHGIEPTKFFQKPFDRAFEALPDDVVQAYSLDIDRLFESTLNNR